MHHLSQSKSYHGAREPFIESIIAYLLRTAKTTTLLVKRKKIKHASFLLELTSEVSSTNSTHESIPEMVTLAFTPNQEDQSHWPTTALPNLNAGGATHTVSNKADHHRPS